MTSGETDSVGTDRGAAAGDRAGEHETDRVGTPGGGADIGVPVPLPDEERSLTGTGGHRLWHGVWYADGKGPARGTVVIAHGVNEYLGRYGHIIRRLTGAGYTVVGHDHRGHGRSGGPRFTISAFDDFVRDLGLVISRARDVAIGRHGADAPRPFLFGHSMGGLIAIRYVVAMPDQVALSGLILSSPALQFFPDLGGVGLRVAGIASRVVPGFPVSRRQHGILSSDPAVDRRWEADPMLNQGATGLQMAYQIASSAREVRPRLGEITLPLLLFYGEDDRLTDPAGARRLAEMSRSSDLTVRAWPGLRHETFNEPNGDEVLDAVVAWLDRHTAAAR